MELTAIALQVSLNGRSFVPDIDPRFNFQDVTTSFFYVVMYFWHLSISITAQRSSWSWRQFVWVNKLYT